MSRPMRTQPVTASPQARMRLAELAEALLQVVGVHDRDDLYLGVYCHEERLAERDHVGRIWHVEYHEGRPLSSKVPKYIASGFQRSAAVWISSPMLPSLTARLPDSTGIVILAMTRMTAPPLGAAAPVRASPCAWPTGVLSSGWHRPRGLARRRVLRTAAYAGPHSLDRPLGAV